MWVQDVSAASENILLAAHAIGLGATWTGVYPVAERCKAVAEILGLPENIVAFNIIVVGYPKGNGRVKDKWNEENVSWNSFK